MAVQIIGYPLKTNFCPQCGSSNIDTNDTWDGNGKVHCNSCGCNCVIIEDEPEQTWEEKEVE